MWKGSLFHNTSIHEFNDLSDLPIFSWLPKLQKILIKHASYRILVAALLPSYQSIEHPLSQQSKIMWRTKELPLAIVMWFVVPSKLFWGHRKVAAANFSGFSSIFCRFSTLYTSLQHDLIRAKGFSLVKWCFNRDSKTTLLLFCRTMLFEYPSVLSRFCFVFQIRQDFSPTRNVYCIHVGLALRDVKLLLSSRKVYNNVQYDGMVYQQIVVFLWALTVLPLYPTYFYIVSRGILCPTSRNPKSFTL